ncbi:hypothetical protein, partial [uncultured Duncaniella sp.]|uniref:hypothetical protein n=1 Tax=uncultured Duncaniella sp. TaxID=2768039 RepID=UPI00266D78D1
LFRLKFTKLKRKDFAEAACQLTKSCKTARRGFTACLLLFLFKLVMESPLGLRSLPFSIII